MNPTNIFIEAKFRVMDPGIVFMPYPENKKAAFGSL